MREQTKQTNTDTAKADARRGHARVSAKREAATSIEDLRFDLLRSALYHDMRQSRLAQIHGILMFINILLGSAAVAAFGASYSVIGQGAGAAIAIISAAQLVWDFGSAARDHGDLRKRFYTLLSQTAEGADLERISAEMTLVFADEPPVLRRVNKRAHNAAGESLFGDDFEEV